MNIHEGFQIGTRVQIDDTTNEYRFHGKHGVVIDHWSFYQSKVFCDDGSVWVGNRFRLSRSQRPITANVKYDLAISSCWRKIIKETAKEPFAWHIESVNLEGGKVEWWACLWGDMPDGSISEFSAQAETLPLAISHVALLKGGGV